MNLFRTAAEKWILTTTVPQAGFWLNALIMGSIAGKTHPLFFHEPSQLLPPSLSFDKEITRLLQIHQQELERLTRPLLTVNLLISGIASYLDACLLIYLQQTRAPQKTVLSDVVTLAYQNYPQKSGVARILA